MNKTNNPLVSVIMPTYGRPNFLKKSIESVLNQTYSNFELIIVDDNSDEQLHNHTRDVINQYLPSNRIKYFHDGINRGGALARNKGIELSSGEYITFLDDDDQYCPEKIKTQLDHLISNNLDVSVCDMFFLSNKKLIDISNCYARANSASEFVLNGNIYTPMIMITKLAILEIGGFVNTPRYQDHILMLKVFIHNKKIQHLTKKLFIHNDHTNKRITNSSKFADAYYIRNKFEEKLLKQLPYDVQLKYQFKFNLIKARILSNQNKNKEALILTLQTLKNIKSFRDIVRFTKTILRLTFFKKQL